MYDLIYDFINSHLFASTALQGVSHEIGGMTLNMGEWLSHTATIVCVALLVVFAVNMLIWVFKLVGGLFMGIGK